MLASGEDRFGSAFGASTTRRRALGRLAGGALGGALAAGAVARVAPVSAQNGTPTAGGCAAGPGLGTAVSFISVEGAEIGTITIAKITDPFTGYRPNSPPARGNRFILLSVSAKNTGTHPWQFDPGRIFLQDGDGFVVYPQGIDLGDPPVEPALTYQEIAPATSAEGAVGYVVLKGVDPVRVFFGPASDRLVLLADLQ